MKVNPDGRYRIVLDWRCRVDEGVYQEEPRQTVAFTRGNDAEHDLWFEAERVAFARGLAIRRLTKRYALLSDGEDRIELRVVPE